MSTVDCHNGVSLLVIVHKQVVDFGPIDLKLKLLLLSLLKWHSVGLKMNSTVIHAVVIHTAASSFKTLISNHKLELLVRLQTRTLVPGILSGGQVPFPGPHLDFELSSPRSFGCKCHLYIYGVHVITAPKLKTHSRMRPACMAHNQSCSPTAPAR